MSDYNEYTECEEYGHDSYKSMRYGVIVCRVCHEEYEDEETYNEMED